MHVVQPLAIKATDYVHYVAKDDGSVEGSRLGIVPVRFNFGPFSLLDIELMDVVESLLIGVYTAKDVNEVAAQHG